MLTRWVLLGLLAPTPLLADLPAESLVVEAFSPEKRILWQSALGMVTVKPFFSSTDQSPRRYQLRSLPQEQSTLVRAFTQVDLGLDIPANREEVVELKGLGWEDREIRKELTFLDWPFFVSAFGPIEDLPGWVMRLPILESRNGWIRILVDWNSSRTAWLKYDADESLEVLLFPTQFGVEWIGEGTHPRLTLVSETLEIRDRPNGTIIQRMRGDLERIQPEEAVVRYNLGDHRYELLQRHAAKRYSREIRYDVPSYGYLDLVEIRGNWVKVTWYIQPENRIYAGWVQLRGPRGNNFWIRGDSSD
jgi:hypothetical protein